MNKIYLDNAATTPLDKEVLEAMLPYMTEHFGNPSSIYANGRTTRLAIENARKSVAKNMAVKPSEIIFTSGGTESNNMAILSSIRDLGCNHIITSPIEHHAVLHTVQHYHQWLGTGLTYVNILPDGKIDYEDLEQQLKKKNIEGKKCLVSLMHANNEIGNLLDIEMVAKLCRQHAAIFHSDCVQTVGHYPIDLHHLGIDFISGSAHKFHGPKGSGILYVNEALKIHPLILGGGQERNLRAGTENVYGIIGFATALEKAMENFEQDSKYIKELKRHLFLQLDKKVKKIEFNGNMLNSLYSVLSVAFPKNEATESLLLELDMQGIAVSGGSACTAGAASHVMKALNKVDDFVTIRFSLSKYNTKEEIDKVVATIKACTQQEETIPS